MLDIPSLKSNLDLVAVITQRGVKLTRAGASLKGRCPFHEDSTPSFSVTPAKQLWRCFGCQKGGDVFTFVMEQEQISFVEAVRKLCKQDIQEKDLETLNREREIDEPRAVDRPGGEILARIVAHWQEALARTPTAQGYLKGRSLWVPEVLRALSVGYSSGRLPRVLPEDGKLVRQLKEMRILNARGNEFFFSRIVVPIFDDAGVLVTIYGRAISGKSKVPHLYLPGPRRGVFNPVGIRDAERLILTESILDALSLVALGFTHTTASYGAGGFTADHLAAFKRAKTTRVYCAYDADPVGEAAAQQLALRLATHGIECLRVALPDTVKDPNDFLRAGGTREAFQALLDAARPMIAPPPPAAAPSPAAPPTGGGRPGRARTVQRGERTYEVTPVSSVDTLALRVRLKVHHEGRTFIDTINLYSDRARMTTVNRLVRVFGEGAKRETIEEDLFSLVDELEAHAAHAAGDEPAGAKEPMSDADHDQAVAFLSSPTLADQIREDVEGLDVVGEARAKLLVYLVATSRRLVRPLSLVVVSRSSAGKSYVVSKVSELVPEDEVLAYTRMSSKALFHDESDRLRHKLLTIEEAQGMEEAAYALRVMQSNQCLRNLSTITDPTTGKHKAQENVVHGPVALIVTTTEELDFETVSRAFVISVDESVEQTRAIHDVQRASRTIEGLRARVRREAIVRRHRNAQRLLASLAVVNPYAKDLTFPTGTLRLRREHEKYLTLIDAITYLFQYQRKQDVIEVEGEKIPYVMTAPADIDLANELVVASLRQAFEEVTVPSRELLIAIRKMVTETADGDPLTAIRFSRRQVREYTGWSDYQVRIHLKQLEELEYVAAVAGSFGKEYVYTLSPDHRLALDSATPLDVEIRELGLTGSSELAAKKAKKG